MSDLIAHRGPDGSGLWERERGGVAFGHRRLAIIDLRRRGAQPMTDGDGALDHVQRRDLQLRRAARGARRAGLPRRLRHRGAAARLRAAGASTAWSSCAACSPSRSGTSASSSSSARATASASSRCTTRRSTASSSWPREAKALLPFLPASRPTPRACRTTSRSSSCCTGARCSAASRSCLPGHYLLVRDGEVVVRRYWEVQYEPDFDHTERYFADRLEELVQDSVRAAPALGRAGRRLRLRRPRLRASSAASRPAQSRVPRSRASPAASTSARPSTRAATPATSPRRTRSSCTRSPITPRGRRSASSATSSTTSTSPSPGPGSIPQYMVSELAARARQGRARRPGRRRDLRRLRALPHRVLRAVHQGGDRGHGATTATSSSPTSRSSRAWPRCGSTSRCCAEFWRDGLFEDLDRRYYRLVDRAPQLAGAIDPGRVRRRVAVRALPPHLPGRQRAQGVVLRLA